MLVIFGWMRRFTTLGVKFDECSECGNACQHVVGRKTNWGHIFWIPFLFLGFQHGMLCSACGTWTGLPWRQVRAAMKSGVLTLDRARPSGPEILQALAVDDGAPPPTLPEVFDRFVVNPRRGPWDLYLKAWPVIVGVLLVAGSLSPRTSTAGSAPAPLTPSLNGTAHQCWESANGEISGCRLANGSTRGVSTGSPITCYFTEPLPPEPTALNCR